MGSPRLLELKILSDLAQVAWVGVSARAVARDASFSDDDADAIELAVVELVNNAIEHAYELQPGHPIWVRIREQPGELVIEVRHQGAALTPQQLEQVEPSADELATGGRGLALVHALMDSVELLDDGVRMVRRLSALSDRVEAAAEMKR